MVNDTNTLNGALMELGETLATNITAKGVSASASDGLTTLANKVLQISGDTPTPTPTVLFYDDCSTDRSSEYSAVNISGFSTPSIVYNSDGYYTINSSSSGNKGLYIGNLSDLQDFKMSMKINRITISGNRQVGLALVNTSNNYYLISRFESSNNSMNVYTQTNSTNVFISVSQTLSNNSWYTLEFTKEGNDYTVKCYDAEGTLLNTGTGTNTTFDNVSTLKAFIFLAWDSNKEFRIKDIKVETLGGDTPCAEYIAEIDSAIEYINGDGS